MKKRFLYLVLPIITLILEALPYGAYVSLPHLLRTEFVRPSRILI